VALPNACTLETMRTGSAVRAFPAESASVINAAAEAKARNKMFGVNIILSSIIPRHAHLPHHRNRMRRHGKADPAEISSGL
jgi:putative hemolysin